MQVLWVGAGLAAVLSAAVVLHTVVFPSQAPLHFRTALVTGVNRGNLGYAFVDEMCRRGVRVVFTVRRWTDPVVASCSTSLFIRVSSFGLDGGESERNAVTEARRLLGVSTIDLLVANHMSDGNYAPNGFPLSEPWSLLERCVLTNYLSFTELLRHALEGGGLRAAIFVSSAAAEMPERNLGHYMASKAAVNAFARSVNAQNCDGIGPLISLVHGPMISTPLVTNQFLPEDVAKRAYSPAAVAIKSIDAASNREENVEFYGGFTAALRCITALSPQLARWIVRSNMPRRIDTQ